MPAEDLARMIALEGRKTDGAATVAREDESHYAVAEGAETIVQQMSSWDR
jgi:hypothetical protein